MSFIEYSQAGYWIEEAVVIVNIPRLIELPT